MRDVEAREALWRGEADNLEPVGRWFKAYADWWKRCKLRPPTRIEDGLLPGDFAYVLEKDDAKFGFVGMNSAFLDLSDEVGEGGLWMDARQIQPACGGNLGAWIERCNLAFLLTHHPPAWFASTSPPSSRTPRRAYAAPLPRYVKDAFERYLACGDLSRGFVRCHCDACQNDVLVAFRCKQRGLCPSCGARRMCDVAVNVPFAILPSAPVRPWVLSLPFELRGLAATKPDVLTALGRIFAEQVERVTKRLAGVAGAATGSISFPHRFGGSLTLHVHFHLLAVDAVFDKHGEGVRIHEAPPPPSSPLGPCPLVDPGPDQGGGVDPLRLCQGEQARLFCPRQPHGERHSCREMSNTFLAWVA